MKKKDFIKEFSYKNDKWIKTFDEIKKFIIEENEEFKGCYHILFNRFNQDSFFTISDILLPFNKEQEVADLFFEYFTEKELDIIMIKYDSVVISKDKQKLKDFFDKWLVIYKSARKSEDVYDLINFELDVKNKKIFFNATKVSFLHVDKSDCSIRDFAKLFTLSNPLNMPFSPKISQYLCENDGEFKRLKHEYLIIEPKNVLDPYEFENAFEAKKFIYEFNKLYKKDVLTKIKNMV